jgi:hypothetical protein
MQNLAPQRLVALALATAVALALLIASETLRLTRAPQTALPIDDRRLGLVLLQGFHEQERDGRGAYRWTMGEAQASFAAPGGGPYVLSLGIGSGVPGGQPSQLTLRLGGETLRFVLAPEPRVYTVVAPGSAAPLGSVSVGLSSETASVAPDPRSVGIRVETIKARHLGAGWIWPALSVVLSQAAILLFAGLIALRCGAPPPAVVALVIALAAPLAWLPSRYPIVMADYQLRLAVAFGLLAALTYTVLPQLERRPSWLGPAPETRALWGITMLASALRLSGGLYPPFAAYDLYLNLERLAATVGGALIATNESFEFGGGVTVYPSGPYLVLMPGMLLGLTPKLAVQGGIGLLDGLFTLAVAALGRSVGMRGRGLLFACLAYAAVPINMATLYHGHTAQAFGQGLMAPLAVALLLGIRGVGGRWPWLVAWALLSMALLSHIGVTILALAWLGLAWLALTLRRTLDGAMWRTLTLTLFLGGLSGLVLVYGPTILAHLDTVTQLQSEGSAVSTGPAYNLIAKAWRLSYTELGLLLAVAALLFLARRWSLPRGAPEILGAWLGASMLFWAVEMVSGLQVRYLVFLVPLVCLLIGAALEWLAERRAYGPALAWALSLVLLVQGAWVWYPGAFERIAPSMVMLLR